MSTKSGEVHTALSGVLGRIGLFILDQNIQDQNGNGPVTMLLQDVALGAELLFLGGNNFHLVDEDPKTGLVCIEQALSTQLGC